MRILFVLKNLRLDSGVNTAVAETISELRRRDYPVSIAALNGDGELLDHRVTPNHVHLNRLNGGRLRRIAKIRRLILNRKIDVVHSHLFEPSLVGSLATLGTAAAAVVTEHSTRYPALTKVDAVLEKMLVRTVNHEIVAVSHSVATACASRIGVPLSRLRVIHNGLRATHAMEPRPQTSSRNAYELLIAGRLEVEKNVKFAIDVAKTLIDRGEQVRLNVAGSGSMRSFLENYSGSLSIGSHVRFLGVIPDMRRLMQTMDVLLLPSLWEGCPMVVIEAYSAGLPVAAASVPGARDIVTDGVTGVLFDNNRVAEAAARVQALLHDERLRGSIIAGAADRVKSFDISGAVDQLLECYKSAVHQKRSA